jgi:glycosyltransferase involved in cell wall biosynthesis
VHLIVPGVESRGSVGADTGGLDVGLDVAPIPGFAAVSRAAACANRRRRCRTLFELVFWALSAVRYVVFTVFMLARALAVARRERFDIVYAHHDMCAAAGFAAGRLLGLPAVCRLYGSPLKSWVDRGKWGIQLRYPGLALPFMLPFDLTVAVDDGSAMDRIAEHFGTDLSRFRMWPNGVQPYEIPQRPPTKRKLAARHPALDPAADWLLVVGRLIEEKRFDRVLRAMPRVLEARPATQLVVVGSGHRREPLERLADEIGVARRVAFLGALPHDEIMPLRLRSAAFISTSDRSNRLNVLREAFQCGLPAIVVRDGTTDDMVADGENGLFVEKDDAAGLAAAAVRILKDPALRRRLSAKALAAGRALWTWDQRMEVEVGEVARLVGRI